MKRCLGIFSIIMLYLTYEELKLLKLTNLAIL